MQRERESVKERERNNNDSDKICVGGRGHYATQEVWSIEHAAMRTARV